LRMWEGAQRAWPTAHFRGSVPLFLTRMFDSPCLSGRFNASGIRLQATARPANATTTLHGAQLHCALLAASLAREAAAASAAPLRRCTHTDAKRVLRRSLRASSRRGVAAP
jgi:hypothetical protein